MSRECMRYKKYKNICVFNNAEQFFIRIMGNCYNPFIYIYQDSVLHIKSMLSRIPIIVRYAVLFMHYNMMNTVLSLVIKWESGQWTRNDR